MAKPDHDTIMRLIREHFSPELQKAVTVTRWKDGIDVDYPVYAIEAFYESVANPLRTALELISQLNDAKIEDAPPEIVLELLRSKVGTARNVLALHR